MTCFTTLVSTILNDRQGAIQLLADLATQTRQPDEFVVVDGGSTDGTYEYLCEQAKHLPFSLQVFQEVGANVSRGRNLAIEKAKHDVILSTDFGCRLNSRWVEFLVAPFEQNPATEVVTGSWKVSETNIQTPAQWAEWALLGGRLELIATPTCLASTRSIAFKKQVWLDFGKYPEDLSLAGDDAIFSLWMVSSQRHIAAAPEALCYWHRFAHLKSYWKEARRNFRGAGEAVFFLNYGIRVGLLFALEMAALLSFVGLLVGMLFGIPVSWVLAALVVMLGVWAKRLLRWRQAIAILASRGKVAYWPSVILLDLGLRFNGVYGYWRGFIHGFWHCQSCRQQMQQLAVQRW